MWNVVRGISKAVMEFFGYGEREYPCSFCTATFYDLDACTNHAISVHLDELE